MEQNKYGSDSKNIDCMFYHACNVNNIACSSCVDIGIYSVLDLYYLPRTFIPKNYYNSLGLWFEDPDVNYFMTHLGQVIEKGLGMYCYSKTPGTGKTTACIQALLTFLFRDVKGDPYDLENRRVLYLNTTEFLDRLRKSYSSPDPELEQLLWELTTISTAPKLILFDDIGSERCGEWVQERLYSLINYRVSNGLASLFTSNYSVDEISKTLGSRIGSRIRGCAKEIMFQGKDLRRCIW